MNHVDQHVVDETVHDLNVAVDYLMQSAVNLYGISTEFGSVAQSLAEAMTIIDNVIKELSGEL